MLCIASITSMISWLQFFSPRSSKQSAWIESSNEDMSFPFVLNYTSLFYHWSNISRSALLAFHVCIQFAMSLGSIWCLISERRSTPPAHPGDFTHTWVWWWTRMRSGYKGFPCGCLSREKQLSYTCPYDSWRTKFIHNKQWRNMNEWKHN